MAKSLTLVAALFAFAVLTFAAPPAEGAAASSNAFALVIANNHSTNLSVADLQYADDDAARYYQIFRAAAGETNVALLTTFDRATLRLYPKLAETARPATRKEVRSAVARLRDVMAAAQGRGESIDFYLVYAGHGEVREGRGYLELEDERIDGSFLEREILDRLPAQTKHVILDSCNSFFVINPRSPGGRRWATPKDMALGFSARHPEVGLFLSTNSDTDVFEWSDIESGVFSHEVRSGLSGGADVNGDGTVSYSELAGFVERANAGIAREALRPHLFYRGPHGDPHAPLFSFSAMTGRKVVADPAQTRLWIKNATGARVLDVHKEPGPLTLVVPGGDAEDLSVFVERRPLNATARPSIVEHIVERGSEPIRMAALTPRAPIEAVRGARLFGALFESPYGPVSYARYLAESAAAPEPVYGPTEADLTRMRNYLSAIAEEGRTERRVSAQLGLGGAAVLGGIAVVGALDPNVRKDTPWLPITLGAVSVGAVGMGLYQLFTPSTSERALDVFDQELAANKGDRGLTFVKTETWLTKVAEREQAQRNFVFWVCQGGAVGIAGLATAYALKPPPNASHPAATAGIIYGIGALTSGLGFAFRSMDTPVERMLKLYRDDPGLQLHFDVSVLPGGGGTAGIVGSF
ncbi:MAG TPA: caspase family protein [Polyangiaceae bacterium]